MTKDLGLTEIDGPQNPERLRWWLLCKALECVTLDQALDLAGAAYAFVSGSSTTAKPRDIPVHADQTLVENIEMVRQEEHRFPTLSGSSNSAPVKRSALNLSPEHRAELLRRLANGAKNAELATEFGLSRQQVQGIRMGCAREIATFRQEPSLSPPQVSLLAARGSVIAEAASAEEVIRYLRQQDDVVVPQGSEQFLVNGRFRLGLTDLLERANRMRRRQGKSEFKVATQSKQPVTVASANGHPLFWAKELPTAKLTP